MWLSHVERRGGLLFYLLCVVDCQFCYSSWHWSTSGSGRCWHGCRSTSVSPIRPAPCSCSRQHSGTSSPSAAPVNLEQEGPRDSECVAREAHVAHRFGGSGTCRLKEQANCEKVCADRRLDCRGTDCRGSHAPRSPQVSNCRNGSGRRVGLGGRVVLPGLGPAGPQPGT